MCMCQGSLDVVIHTEWQVTAISPNNNGQPKICYIQQTPKIV